MSEIVHADIFFFITAIAVIVVGIGMSIVLYYAVGILRDVRAIAGKLRKAGDEIQKDFEDLRANVRSEGVRARTIVELLFSFIERRILKPRTRKPKEEKEGGD